MVAVVINTATSSVSAASSCRHRNQEGGWVLFAFRARVGGCIPNVGVLPGVRVLCEVYLGREWKRMPTMAASHGGCHLLPPQATIRWLCVFILFSVDNRRRMLEVDGGDKRWSVVVGTIYNISISEPKSLNFYKVCLWLLAKDLI
ncbi:unnamed protein product [Lactuca saligna]|uniref:Uncharacterized protein n=1 Tax=Lactuca saligna TaxID=75948 RepID=A0AA36E201_LACSI|nr:unnamed protein product [Lactuca saligna]